MEIWEPKPPGTLWATLGLLCDSFTFLLLNIPHSDATYLSTGVFLQSLKTVFIPEPEEAYSCKRKGVYNTKKILRAA